MSRGKGRMAIIPRTVVDRVAKPGLSPGERRQAQVALAHARAGIVMSRDAQPMGGQKRSKARAKMIKQSKRRNRS